MWWRVHLETDVSYSSPYSLLQLHFSKEENIVPIRNTHTSSTHANSVTLDKNNYHLFNQNNVSQPQLTGGKVGLQWKLNEKIHAK